ncbi:MAG TPA: PEP-CTERM sorting domain-containing protein [Burkholderiaceae bacterium]|jgi:hypothetical protein
MMSFHRSLKPLVLAIGLLTGVLATAAPTVTYSGGIAIGVQDLVVSGVNYDVSFVTGSYNSLFASTPPTFLGNAAGALEAGLALINLMNAQTATLLGNSGTCCGAVFVPYADSFIGSDGSPVTPPYGQPDDWFKSIDIAYQDGTGEFWARYGDSLALKAIDVADYNSYDWRMAMFTADAPQNDTPEPDALVLACTALAGLAWTRRRKRIDGQSRLTSAPDMAAVW